MSDPVVPATASVMTGLDEPATARQRGALAGEFERLGYSRGRIGRNHRLAVCATLLDIDELSSSTELTKGETGRLLRMLRECRTTDDLWTLAGLHPLDAETGTVAT